MITLCRIRELDLAMAPAPGRPRHLSAASGLVRAGSYLYVVADDELHLGVFRTDDPGAGRLVRLFSGTLPAAAAARKAGKPDFEALTLLPPTAEYPHGALLALGSGSTLQRRAGALLALDAQGAPGGLPRVCQLSGLYSALDQSFAALNIEGAFINANELCLLQRGNRRLAQNAIIRFPLPAALDAVLAGTHIAPSALHPLDLGSVDGVPMCFTDGAALPGGDIVFSAVAEDTPDSYQDGPCAGAVIGIATRDGDLRCLERLDEPHKIEGIDARLEGDIVRLLLVTDADDAGIPACLFSAALEKSYTRGA